MLLPDTLKIHINQIEQAYYHGYINKIIGLVIEYQRINKGDLRHTSLYAELADDKDFLQGLTEYQCRNQHETEITLNMLKELMRSLLEINY